MPEILYVSARNMGVSRIAESLTRMAAPAITVLSAGVEVRTEDRGVDENARRACAEIGARCDGDPLQLTPSLADRADIVIILGDVDVSGHIAPDVETRRWELPDPAEAGVGGVERYRRLRDALRERIMPLLAEIGQSPKMA